MARQPRNTQTQATEEAIGFLNIYTVKGGRRTTKVAWQVVNEGDKLSLIAERLPGTYTSSTGVTIEIEFNAVAGDISADDLI